MPGFTPSTFSTRLFQLQPAPVAGAGPRPPRAPNQGGDVRLPDVRQLSPAGDRVQSARWNAPRVAQRPCGRLDDRALLRFDETRPCIWYRIYNTCRVDGTHERAPRSSPPSRLVESRTGNLVRSVREGPRSGHLEFPGEHRLESRTTAEGLGKPLPGDQAAFLVAGGRPAAPAATAPAGLEARGEAPRGGVRRHVGESRPLSRALPTSS